ncbi:CRISPR-associated endonuclease Cas2 [Sporolactobacillus inulinus]|uniref:CRISPR-associated endoribonuclease Cas2 n=1 Tax=Sporolactobacillus inulinus CASD TaxID=1069536 RepID=A0A0U1QT46_9BACL|nr:CRISPR-associated endonuclease Cas2 [Sporolactobacillus inulinus]KLI03953.1 CRISPR-associated protein Cas2 [Sporolactobacillus inulinus CASD]GEB77859.1 hypothetical protein SIN01_22040 [Sporolactobacillus inulinus]
MKHINANYAFVFYDVNEKRVQKIFKICKKYLSHYQKSVFRGKISSSNLIKLEQEIRSKINRSEDFVTIIKMTNDKQFEEVEIGKPEEFDSLFL